MQQILDTLFEIAKNVLFQVSQWSGRVLGGMKLEGNYWILLDIVIVAFIIYWFLSRILESKAVRILYGIIIIFFLLLLGHFLDLMTLSWLMKYLGIMLAVVIPIIFQPEIRGALNKLGSLGIRRTHFSKAAIEEILASLEILAKNKVGAMIAIEKKIPLKEYIKSGHSLHADVSKELILSIFAPHSPMHDGAMIISGDKVIASGCMFPLPEDHDRAGGARHRAAKTLSATTDAIILVVSEESGVISAAYQGELESDLSLKEIKRILTKLFTLK